MNRLAGHYTYGRLLRYCLAPVAMMVFSSIYGVVDGFFVSNWAGQTAFAAVNLIMPALMILGGLGFMYGTGGTALAARTLGEGKKELASRYFSMVTWTAVVTGVLTGALGSIFAPDIARLLGADAGMMKDCVEYARVILFFNATFILQNVFQSFLAAAGRPGLGFVCTVAAGITNMILDWLFIAVFGWGTSGAALATGLGTCVGSIPPLVWFMTSRSSSLRLMAVVPAPGPVARACLNGCGCLWCRHVCGFLLHCRLLRLHHGRQSRDFLSFRCPGPAGAAFPVREKSRHLSLCGTCHDCPCRDPGRSPRSSLCRV